MFDESRFAKRPELDGSWVFWGGFTETCCTSWKIRMEAEARCSYSSMQETDLSAEKSTFIPERALNEAVNEVGLAFLQIRDHLQ